MTIPIVIINYNSLTFLKSFVFQIHDLTDHIIILDNCSTYPPLLEYYESLKDDENVKFTIHRFSENFGHKVYYMKSELLPSIYFLSDPDLKLPDISREELQNNFLNVSERFNAHKVGCALDLDDCDRFIKGSYGQLFMSCETGYYKNKINNDMGLELYTAPIDTTFCLVNQNISNDFHIRIGGDYKAKHLPWYQDYLKHNIPMAELQYWAKHNISSSILEHLSKSDLGIHEE